MRGDDPVPARIAAEFWRRAGVPAAWPLDVDQGVAIALPATVVLLPALRLRGIEQWLHERGIQQAFRCPDRAVHGCLFAWQGHGLIFVDGTDPADERRYTVAHETAHFLLDYHLPRTRAINRLGPSILDVLDGRRRPTAKEAMEGWQAELPVQPHVHLMEERAGRFVNAEVYRAEECADLLALELLAPAEAVMAMTPVTPSEVGYCGVVAALDGVLVGTCGLPQAIASQYARHLGYRVTGGPDLVDAFGLRGKTAG